MTLSAWDLCFPSIFEDIGDYVPSTTKTPSGTRRRERYRERERDRERDRDRDRERERERDPKTERDRGRKEEKKRHSYFEKPKVDDEVVVGHHMEKLPIFVAAQPGIEPHELYRCLMAP